jgi:hypothetical protein
LFYLLDGEMRVVCGAKERAFSSGGLVFLPHGIEHVCIITSETPVLLVGKLRQPGGGVLIDVGRIVWSFDAWFGGGAPTIIEGLMRVSKATSPALFAALTP